MLGRLGLAAIALQLPVDLPYPKTAQGVLVSLVTFMVITYVTHRMTKSRLAWFAGVVIGLIAGSVFN